VKSALFRVLENPTSIRVYNGQRQRNKRVHDKHVREKVYLYRRPRRVTLGHLFARHVITNAITHVQPACQVGGREGGRKGERKWESDGGAEKLGDTFVIRAEL